MYRPLDADYYVFSFYKTYGPHFAVLYGRYDLLRELDNLYHYFYDKDKVPAKLEPGNTNYETRLGLCRHRGLLLMSWAAALAIMLPSRAPSRMSPRTRP